MENYHAFIKKSLQNILILETQFCVQESCLKSKQKSDKACSAEFDHEKVHKAIQTEDYLNVICGRSFDFEEYCTKFPQTARYLENIQQTVNYPVNLVDYNVESDFSGYSSENDGKVIFPSTFGNFLQDTKPPINSVICKNDTNLIMNIMDDPGHIARCQPKIFEINSSKRKSKVPKKISTHVVETSDENEDSMKQNNSQKLSNAMADGLSNWNDSSKQVIMKETVHTIFESL